MTGLRVDAELAVLAALGLDEFGGLGRSQLVGSQIIGHRDPLRVFSLRLGRDLEVGSVAADTQVHALADGDGVDLSGVDVAEVVDDRLETFTILVLIAEVETGQPVVAVLFAHGDPVEFGFEIGGERIVDQSGEVLLEQPHDRERQPAGHEGIAASEHISAVLDDRDGGRIGRGPPDAELLELLDQARLGEARRRSGGVTIGFGIDHRQGLPLFDLGQTRLPGLRVVAGGVLPLFVGGEEAAEGDDGAAGAEPGFVAVGECGADLDRRGLALGVGHLAGHGALPDQVVETEFVTGQLFGHLCRGAERVTGGADRLVGLLRGLLLARVLARRLGYEFGSVEFGHLLPCGRDGLARQCRGVGAHIGDVAVFVQRLRRAHGLTGAHAQLASGLLLQRRGGEWCGGTAGVGLRLHRGHGQRILGAAVQFGGEGFGPGLIDHRHRGVLQLALVVEVPAGGHTCPVEGVEVRGEGVRPVGQSEVDVEVPVVGGHEGHAFAFAFDDEAGGHRLHTSGGESGTDLAPQHG